MSGSFSLVLVACLLAQAFCVPTGDRPWRSHRPLRAAQDNEVDDNENQESSDSSPSTTSTTARSSFDDDDDDDDDDDFGESMSASPTTSGSNIFSLINLASALFPSASGANRLFWNALGKNFLGGPQYPQLYGYQPYLFSRKDIADNLIQIDYVKKLTPPFQRQEDLSDDDDVSEESDENFEENDDNNAAEESVEKEEGSQNKESKQESLDDNEDDDYSDEPPEGDGQGGGLLGLLAGLSGGEDGQSDLGSLLATVSGIVASLSGDGFDLNALIASGIGLVAGLLSEGNENPGSVIASYLLTSLDTITGGGAQNNGAFFGNFLSKLVKGTSAVPDESGSSEENKGPPMSDSVGFVVSLLMGLLGDMSKGSSGSSSSR